MAHFLSSSTKIVFKFVKSEKLSENSKFDIFWLIIGILYIYIILYITIRTVK
jgi:hypothetical protein